MAKDFAKSFYNSKAWKSCREAYIRLRILIDGGLCEICRCELGYIVHHKEKLTPENINDPEITLNHKNLEYACKKCHDSEHFEDIYGVKSEKAVCTFDENGEPIPPIR